MINADQLALLDRRAKALYDDHVRVLLSMGDSLLSAIEPTRPVTIQDSINAFPPEVGKAMNEYGQALETELLDNIGKMRVKISESDAAAVLEIAKKYVDHMLYPRRLQIHLDSISRKLSRQSVSANVLQFRTDLAKASVEAAALNGTRRILGSIKNDLDLLLLTDFKRSEVATSEGSHTLLEEANKTLELKPNFMGLGINLNYLLSKLFRRKRSK